MIKSLRYLLLTALTLVCGSMFAQDGTATWNGAESSALPTEMGDDITLAWLEASGDQAPSFNSTKKAASMKKGNKLTIAGADANVTISEIVFTFDNSSDPGLSANEGSTTSNYADNTTTWTGEANSITFTAGGSRLIKAIKVTYTGKAAVGEKVPVLAIAKVDNFNTTYDMDATDNKTLVVYYENTGKAAAENAELTLYVDGNENKVVEIGTIAAGATDGWKNISYDLTKIEAGEHVVFVALTADGVEAVKSEQKIVTFTKKAPEATFVVTAVSPVNVAYGATSFNITATIKNTSETVDATDVVLTLWQNGTVGTQTVSALAHGAEAEVVFTVNAPETGFPVDRTVTYYVQAPKNQSQAEVEVIFAEQPVEEVKDLAVIGIDGTIDLGAVSSAVRISVENKGNVDIESATVTLKAGDKTLGESKVTNVAAGKTGFCNVMVPSEGLTPGELTVTATVALDGDATPADNTMEATLTVKEAEVPEPVFAIATEKSYEFTLGEPMSITVTVINTSEVEAKDVDVKLFYSTMEVAKQTVAELPPYEPVDVVFTLPQAYTALLETYMGDADTKSFDMQAVVGNTSCFFTVTLKKAVTPVYDLAVTSIQGELSVDNETNFVTVFVENKGNVDIDDAILSIAYASGEDITGYAETVAVKAGSTAFKSFEIPAEDLKAGEFTVFATVGVYDEEGESIDTDETNNTLERTFIVTGTPVAQPTFAVTAENVSVEYGAKSFNIVAVVKNTSEVDGDVEVKLLQGTEVVDATTVTVAAGDEATVTFTLDAILEAGKTATYYVQAGNAQAEVTVTFEQEPVIPIVDLAVTAITGSLDLTLESNNLTVFVNNLGTVDVNDAIVTLTAGEKVLGTATLSAKAGTENNHCTITINTADLQEGNMDITATVEAEGDADLTNNTLTHSFNITTAISAIKAQFGDNVQIFNLSGKKVTTLRPGHIYIINGKKMMVK